MRCYLVTAEPYHDNSEPIGVRLTKRGAMRLARKCATIPHKHYDDTYYEVRRVRGDDATSVESVPSAKLPKPPPEPHLPPESWFSTSDVFKGGSHA